MEKLKIFIDAEYLLQSLRALKDKPEDSYISKFRFYWQNFVEMLTNNRTISEVSYYTAKLSEEENQRTYNEQVEFLDKVYTALSMHNVKIRTGKMIKTKLKLERTWNDARNEQIKHNANYTWTQKGIDTKIVLDLCKFASESKPEDNNCAILIAGDEDFYETIEYITQNNIKTEVVTFDRFDSPPSNNLIKAATKHIVLNYEDLVNNDII